MSELCQRHVLVGLVGLCNMAGAAHHGGDAGILEQARLGAKSYQCGAWLIRGLAGQALGQPCNGRMGIAQKAGHLANGLKPEAGIGRHFFHRQFQRLGMRQDLVLHFLDVGGRQAAKLVAKPRIARYHVVGNTALELAHASG